MIKSDEVRRGFTKNRTVRGALIAVSASALAVAVAVPSLAQDDNGDDPSPTTEELEEGTEDGTDQDGDDSKGGDADAENGDEDAGDGLTEGDGGLSEGTGAINPDLDLKSVNVEILNLDDSDSEYAKFTFSRSITSIDDPAGFELSGYSTEASATSDDAKLVQGNPSAVLAAYEPGTDLESFTIGTIAAGTVSDESGRTNLPSTENLSGSKSRIDGTDAPRLVGVKANDTIDQITYTFDRVLTEEASADSLGFYTSSGREVGGSEVVTTDKRTVTVKFDGQVEDAAAYFAKSGAVTDSRGLASVPNTIGSSTAAPHLTKVSDLIGSTQFEFTFSEPVSEVSEENFLVYTAEGSVVEGSGAVQPSAKVVRVAFPEIQLYGDTITLAAIDAGAVTSNDGSSTANTIASRVVGDATGVTAGPDLESVSVEEATGQVRYTFDKAIDDRESYDASSFSLITDSGDVVKATSFVEVSGDSVVLNFNRAAARSAEALTLEEGAVQDFRGNQSAQATQNL